MRVKILVIVVIMVIIIVMVIVVIQRTDDMITIIIMIIMTMTTIIIMAIIMSLLIVNLIETEIVFMTTMTAMSITPILTKGIKERIAVAVIMAIFIKMITLTTIIPVIILTGNIIAVIKKTQATTFIVTNDRIKVWIALRMIRIHMIGRFSMDTGKLINTLQLEEPGATLTVTMSVMVAKKIMIRIMIKRVSMDIIRLDTLYLFIICYLYVFDQSEECRK